MHSIATDTEAAAVPGRRYLDRWVIVKNGPVGSAVPARYWTGQEWTTVLRDARKYRLPGYAKLGEQQMRKRVDILPGWPICICRLYQP